MTQRTLQQRERIVAKMSAPYLVQDFLSPSTATALLHMFDTADKTVKNTGPVTVDVTKDMLSTPIFQSVLMRLQEYIGEFDVASALFFQVTTPHIIHNDDTFEYPTMYKALTLPLEIVYGSYDNEAIPHLCFFDQYYLDGPAKFFNGSSNIRSFYNEPIYEYSQVQNKTTEPFDVNVREEYLPHIRMKWLDGLSFHSAIPWKPCDAMIFDSVRLHCASDFRTQGILAKVGLSIFTKQKE